MKGIVEPQERADPKSKINKEFGRTGEEKKGNGVASKKKQLVIEELQSD